MPIGTMLERYRARIRVHIFMPTILMLHGEKAWQGRSYPAGESASEIAGFISICGISPSACLDSAFCFFSQQHFRFVDKGRGNSSLPAASFFFLHLIATAHTLYIYFPVSFRVEKTAQKKHATGRCACHSFPPSAACWLSLSPRPMDQMPFKTHRASRSPLANPPLSNGRLILLARSLSVCEAAQTVI